MRVANMMAALLMAVAAAGASADAPANDSVQVGPSEVVAHADLDLSAPEGMKTLYRRIQSAARAVCEPQDPFFYFAGQRARAECVRLTVAHAVAQLDRPALTRLHDSEITR